MSIGQLINFVNKDGFNISFKQQLGEQDNQKIDSKIVSIRETVFATIRSHMPIESLFNPELKINLGVFIKDQMLFQKVAEFLLTLTSIDSVDLECVAKHFEGRELLSEIRGLFKIDSTPYLKVLYAACVDALKKKPSPKGLKPAIEGRIFTLKNALIAQHSPQTIKKSQSQYRFCVQSLSDIKEEGESFLRESLGLYLYPIAKGKDSLFKETLTSTTEQLVSFVRKITKMFLKDRREICSDNPLTFRNPTGYNHHGLVASTVMEACLNALGYTTRLMTRGDLEPKVTLATAHNIIEVIGPDNLRYIVDSCYLQFHKDICISDDQLPKAPTLVLNEDELDQYIEENFMVHWRRSYKALKSLDEPTVLALYERDLYLSVFIECLPVHKELYSSNVELWAKNSFRRVWDLSTYRPVLFNEGFQEIFNGMGESRKTYDTIKALEIAPLTKYSLTTEVENRLDALLSNQKLKGKNSLEALSLISQIPFKHQKKYFPLLDLDPRITEHTGFKPTINGYFRSLKKLVNPEGKDKSVIYACSGADCMSVLLSTDANDFTFIDTSTIRFSEFESALIRLQDRDFLSDIQLKLDLTNSDNFLITRAGLGGASSHFDELGKLYMNDLALKLLFDLREIGVDLKTVSLVSIQDGQGVQIDFIWQYHGSSTARERRVTLMTADITKPGTYPVLLNSKLEESYDIFYMKAPYLVPLSYSKFLPSIAKSLKKGGWLMTVDKSITMESVNPDKYLNKKDERVFVSRKSEETELFEALMIPPFDPMAAISQLDSLLSDNRYLRNPGLDITYWSILNLRQKVK